ncbi:MAG: redoxin domain-containing protein [Pseudomonadota bacterium]
MQTLDAAAAFPTTDIPQLGGGTLHLGVPGSGKTWQMVVIYRGLHCPICKRFLGTLQTMLEEYHAADVDVVVASGDPEDKARAFAEEVGLTMPVGYGLSVAQMRGLGLYISDPRSPKETDRPFPEPGLFVINDAGALQITDISNAPFARPDLGGILRGITFIRENAYPIRGTHGL